MIIHKEEKKLDPNILNAVITPAPSKIEGCKYCNAGYAVRDNNGDIRAWIDKNELVIQEFDEEKDRPFELRFKLTYCPHCGRRIRRNQ